MHKVLSVLTMIILVSCSGKEADNKNDKPEVPEALQEKSINLGRYSQRNDNLTEELYQDLLTKSPELKNLETELEEFDTEETRDQFYSYDDKSNNYYRSATNQADKITDSVTKNKMIALIKKSNEKYSGKTAELNEILKSIRNKRNSINDCHTVLKIALTLPIIEKYQDENLPGKSEFEKIIPREEKLIAKIKKSNPK